MEVYAEVAPPSSASNIGQATLACSVLCVWSHDSCVSYVCLIQGMRGASRASNIPPSSASNIGASSPPSPHAALGREMQKGGTRSSSILKKFSQISKIADVSHICLDLCHRLGCSKVYSSTCKCFVWLSPDIVHSGVLQRVRFLHRVWCPTAGAPGWAARLV